MPKYAHRDTNVSLRCSTENCGHKAYYYCNVCSIGLNIPKAYCGPKSGRDCFPRHLQDINNANFPMNIIPARTPTRRNRGNTPRNSRS